MPGQDDAETMRRTRAVARGRPCRSTATPSRSSQPAIERSSAASSAATRPRSTSGSANAPCTRRTRAWRSDFRSTRADQPVAEQERQHVVAVDPLGRRHVDLDAVPHAEQALGAGTLPDQRVERRQQRPGPDPAGQARVGVQVRRLPSSPRTATGTSRPSSTSSAMQGPRSRQLKPEVVGQVARGADAEAAAGESRGARAGVGLGRGRRARTAAGIIRSGMSYRRSNWRPRRAVICPVQNRNSSARFPRLQPHMPSLRTPGSASMPTRQRPPLSYLLEHGVHVASGPPARSARPPFHASPRRAASISQRINGCSATGR